MTQLNLLSPPIGRPSIAIGLPLRQIHGHWTAAGHSFDLRMRCTMCKIHFDKHQAEPDECPSLHDNKRAKALSKRRELVSTFEIRAKRLKDIASRRGITQAALSRATGYAVNSIQNMMRQKAHVTDEAAAKLGVALSVGRPDHTEALQLYLLGGEKASICRTLGISKGRIDHIVLTAVAPCPVKDEEQRAREKRRKDRVRRARIRAAARKAAAE